MIFIINQLILFKICFTRSDGIYISVTKQSLELNLHWIYIMSILHSCEFSEVYIPSIWKYSSLPISTHLYLCCTTCYHCVGGDRKGESWVEFRFLFFFFFFFCQITNSGTTASFYLISKILIPFSQFLQFATQKSFINTCVLLICQIHVDIHTYNKHIYVYIHI